MCVTGRIAKGKAMHTHSYSFLSYVILSCVFLQLSFFSLFLLIFLHVFLSFYSFFLFMSSCSYYIISYVFPSSLVLPLSPVHLAPSLPPPSLSWGQRHPRLLLLPSFLSSVSLPPFTSIGCLLLRFPSLLWFFPPLESHSSCCLLCICVCQCSRGL